MSGVIKMGIAAWYLEKKQTLRWIAVLVLLLTAYGVYAARWATDPLPQPETLQVVTFLPGATAAEVDLKVSQPLTGELRSLFHLNQIKSVSYAGVVIFTLSGALADNPNDGQRLLERRLAAFASNLPVEIEGPFVLNPTEQLADAMIALTADGYDQAEFEAAIQGLLTKLSKQCEIARIRVLGHQSEAWPLHLTLWPPDSSSNETSKIESVIHQPNESAVLTKGRSALLILLTYRPKVDGPLFGVSLTQILHQQQMALPHGIDLHPVFLSIDDLSGSLTRLEHGWIQSLAIGLALILLLVRGRRGMAVSASVLITQLSYFTMLFLFQAAVTPLRLVGLIISIGMVAAIHWLSIRCIDTVRNAPPNTLFGSWLTTFWTRWLGGWSLVCLALAALVLPFLPLLNERWAGSNRLLSVIWFQLVIAVVVAAFLLPLFIDWISKHKLTEQISRCQRGYYVILSWADRARLVVLFVLLALFMLAIKGLDVLPKQPTVGETGLLRRVEFRAPVGTSLESMTALMHSVDDWLSEQAVTTVPSAEPEESKWVFLLGKPLPNPLIMSYTGQSAPIQRGHVATLWIRYANEQVARHGIAALRQQTNTHWPELTIWTDNPLNPSFNHTNFNLTVTGGDPVSISTSLFHLRQQLLADSKVASVRSSWEEMQKNLELRLFRDRMARTQIEFDDLRLALREHLDQEQQSMASPSTTPASIWLTVAFNGDEWLDAIKVVSSTTGLSVPLSEIAEWGLVFEPSTVVREGGQQQARLQVEFLPWVSLAKQDELIESVVSREQRRLIEAGVTLSVQSHAQSSASSLKSVLTRLAGVVWMLLVLFMGRYGSLRKAGLLLLSPLPTVAGMVGGLWLTGLAWGPSVWVAGLTGLLFSLFATLAFAECFETGRRFAPATEQNCIVHSGVKWAAPFALAALMLCFGLGLLSFNGEAFWQSFATTLLFGVLAELLIKLVVLPVFYSRACSSLTPTQ